MEKFTASNGWTIEVGGGAVSVADPAGFEWDHLTIGQTDALREYFRAERDAELGRWRHPELTDFVVYPEEDDMNTIRVMFEPGGGSSDYKREWLDGVTDPDGWNIARVVRDYFTAHPVRKPWENAKPGEVWALTDSTGERTYLVGEAVRFFPLPLLKPEDAGWEPARFASEFVSGRRIWPEGETTP